MARGSLAGIVSGVVVSGLALGVASLSLPPVQMGVSPPGDAVDAAVMPEAEGTDAPGMAGGETAPGMADGDMDDGDMAPETVPDAEEASEGGDMADAADAPGAADTEAAPEADPAAAPQDQPTAEPLTGDETGADPASAPAEDAEQTPKRGEAAEAEITPQPTGTPLPETDRAPQMESDPVKAPMAAPDEPAAIPGMELVEKLPPALPPASADDAPAAAAPDDVAPEVAPEVTPAEAPDTGADTGPDVGPAPLPDTSADKAPGSALVVEPVPAPAPAPEPEPEPEIAPEPASEPASEPAPAPEPEPEPEIATIVAEPAPAPAEQSPRVAAAPEPAATPEPGPAPDGGLSGADKVVTGRLPTIGDAPEAATPDADAAVAEPDAATLAGLPAIERNRIEFDAAGDQPLLALLLLDSGDRAALEDIGKLPFPLTVAVDAGAADAAEAIAFYDTRGIEVALLLPLPEGATPSDVDVTVQAYRPLLAEAAEVVVDPALGFQALGPGAGQLATNLSESGHGLVSFPSGLNTGHKSAVKQDVPAGLVFLDLDGDGQGGPVIRRFLDNAAFRARNEDGVIVLARTRSETLQALLEWSLGNRAQTVTLAPVSAVLLAE